MWVVVGVMLAEGAQPTYAMGPCCKTQEGGLPTASVWCVQRQGPLLVAQW